MTRRIPPKNRWDKVPPEKQFELVKWLGEDGLAVNGGKTEVGIIIIHGHSYLWWKPDTNRIAMRKIEGVGTSGLAQTETETYQLEQPSLSGQAPYQQVPTCSCRDWMVRRSAFGTSCKHLRAAWFLRLWDNTRPGTGDN